MAGNPKKNPMDARATHTPQPILSPAEAWHLASWSLAEKLLSTPAAELAAMIQNTLEASRDSFLGMTSLPIDLLSQSYKIIGEMPDSLPFPVAHWPTTDEEIRDTWGFVDMTDESDAPFTLVSPFRPVSISSMPVGTQVLRIRDTRHSATAAIVEAMTCANRDLSNALASNAPEMGWRRSNTVINVYRRAARLVFQTLTEEDFVNWSPSAPNEIDISSAPSLVAQIAATAKAQSVLAFQIIASWAQAVVDNAQQAKEPPEVAIQHTRTALEAMNQSLEAFNQTLLLRSKISPPNVRTMVVFRPIPHSIPVMLAIPIDDSNVHKLPANFQQPT